MSLLLLLFPNKSLITLSYSLTNLSNKTLVDFSSTKFFLILLFFILSNISFSFFSRLFLNVSPSLCNFSVKVSISFLVIVFFSSFLLSKVSFLFLSFSSAKRLQNCSRVSFGFLLFAIFSEFFDIIFLFFSSPSIRSWASLLIYSTFFSTNFFWSK